MSITNRNLFQNNLIPLFECVFRTYFIYGGKYSTLKNMKKDI